MLDEALRALRDTLPARLPFSREEPIRTPDEVCVFAATRAAFVTQKTLYGYLRQRIGTRYAEALDDDAFARSVNIARLEVHAAALADLTCFSIATAYRSRGMADVAQIDHARTCYRKGITDTDDGACGPDATPRWLAAFDSRLAQTDWDAGAAAFFAESRDALVRWAPVADHLKAGDQPILGQSVDNAFVAVRAEFVRRLDVRT